MTRPTFRTSKGERRGGASETIDTSGLVQIYRDIARGRFKWSGLPEDMPEGYIEDTALFDCFLRYAPVAHLDRAPDFESGGSRFESCRTQKHIGPLAQLVEQQTLNLWVEGSNPSWLKRLSQTRKSFFYLSNFSSF